MIMLKLNIIEIILYRGEARVCNTMYNTLYMERRRAERRDNIRVVWLCQIQRSPR